MHPQPSVKERRAISRFRGEGREVERGACPPPGAVGGYTPYAVGVTGAGNMPSRMRSTAMVWLQAP